MGQAPLYIGGVLGKKYEIHVPPSHSLLLLSLSSLPSLSLGGVENGKTSCCGREIFVAGGSSCGYLWRSCTFAIRLSEYPMGDLLPREGENFDFSYCRFHLQGIDFVLVWVVFSLPLWAWDALDSISYVMVCHQTNLFFSFRLFV